MSILVFFAGFLVGLFLPGPFNEATRSFFRGVWEKVFGKDE